MKVPKYQHYVKYVSSGLFYLHILSTNDDFIVQLTNNDETIALSFAPI